LHFAFAGQFAGYFIDGLLDLRAGRGLIGELLDGLVDFAVQFGIGGPFGQEFFQLLAGGSLFV
jgi:hypothetical protein